MKNVEEGYVRSCDSYKSDKKKSENKMQKTACKLVHEKCAKNQFLKVLFKKNK